MTLPNPGTVDGVRAVMLVTPRDPIVLPPGLPELDGDGHPLDWSHREAAGLRFERWRAQTGDFDGDRFGLAPEPLPTIDPLTNGRNDR